MLMLLGVGLTADSPRFRADRTVFTDKDRPTILISVQSEQDLSKCDTQNEKKYYNDVESGKWLFHNEIWCHVSNDGTVKAWSERTTGYADKLIEVSSTGMLLLPPLFEVFNQKQDDKTCQFDARTQTMVSQNQSLKPLKFGQADCNAASLSSSLGNLQLTSFSNGPLGDIPLITAISGSKAKSKALIYVVGGPFEGVIGDLNKRHFSRFLLQQSVEKFDVYIPAFVGADRTTMLTSAGEQTAIAEISHIIRTVENKEQYDVICVIGGSFGARYLAKIIPDEKRTKFLFLNPVMYSPNDFLSNITLRHSYVNDQLDMAVASMEDRSIMWSSVKLDRISLFNKYFNDTAHVSMLGLLGSSKNIQIIASSNDAITGNDMLTERKMPGSVVSWIRGADHYYESPRNFVKMQPIIESWLLNC